MTEKISGFVLLIIGISIIIFSSFNVYQTFTGNSESIKPFNLEGIGLDFSSFLVGDATPEEYEQLKIDNNDLKTSFIPSDTLNGPMNLFAHFLLMGFFVNVGFKIGLLGANILRPVKIDVGTNKVINAIEKSGNKTAQAPKLQ